MTFRISENTMERLRRNAKYRGTSLNMLVNRIFKNYVNWYMFESRIGMIPLSKPLVIALFKDLRKDEIVDLATNTGKTATFDIALFMKAKVDVESFLEWFESRMISSSINVSHIINGSTNTYIIKHDVCLNWSLYHKIILESIFDEYFKKDVDIKMSETSFTIQYEK